MNKTCARCNSGFSTPSSKRKYCCVACGIADRKRANWHQVDTRECPQCKRTFDIISWRKKRYCTAECAAASKRGLPNGRALPVEKVRRKRVARVKIEGRTVFLHRHLVEQSIGRRLLPSETVHHIDCDSFNNVLPNLHLFSDEQQHQLAHWSIERLVKPLLDLGVIRFVDGRYELAQALGVAVTAISLQPMARAA